MDTPRTPLVLKFSDRFAVWSDLVRSASNVFSPTADSWTVGESVKVSVEVPDLTAPLVLQGEVWGCRAAGGRFPAGVFLSFDELEVSRCCLVLGLERTPTRVTGRRHPRVDCRLPAQLLKPHEAIAEVTSLSQSGLAMSIGTAPDTNTRVTVELTLPEGKKVALAGVVVWARAMPGAAGLQFDPLDDATTVLIASCVKGLRAHESSLPQRPRTDVLVADDDPQILEFVTRVVRALGYSVTASSRGDEALELARTLRPRLVLLDVLMPGIDGTELCQTLRGDTALSAMGNRLDQVADQAGATDCLAKPLSMGAIKGLVEKYMPRPAPTPAGR